MSKLICPQCRLANTIDCQEVECPGVSSFVPVSWQRPLHQITQDLAKYETLILACADLFDCRRTLGNLDIEIKGEAVRIREKMKKEGGPA